MISVSRPLGATAGSVLAVFLLAATAQIFPVGVAAVATAFVAVRRRHVVLPWARLAVVLELAFLVGMSAHCAGEELWALTFESPWAVASRHQPAALALLLLTLVLVVALVAVLSRAVPMKSKWLAAGCSYVVDELNRGEVK